MNVHATPQRPVRSGSKTRSDRPPFDCIALLLQGGGALGAYQAGVYQSLAEADLHPNWIAGISIGAINAALIAGNAPAARIDKLRAFWELVTTDPLSSWPAGSEATKTKSLVDMTADAFGAAITAPLSLALSLNGGDAESIRSSRQAWQQSLSKAASSFSSFRALEEPRGDVARGLANRWHATVAAMCGAPGFFSPRPVNPSLQPAGTVEATSYYDTSVLKTTLERLVDFDRINAREMRFSVGAVNVATGNFVYFDNSKLQIRPEHVMASGALPPGFPPIEIEGEYYWDGGLVSNTPLQWVMECGDRQDTLAFQVDLWSARGPIPRTLPEVETRLKEIRYSSRTRLNSDKFKKEQRLRNAFADLMAKLPDELRATPEYQLLKPEAQRRVYSIIQLIYRSKNYEGGSKDFEFSPRSMEDHWAAGYHDTLRTLRHPEALERPKNGDGVVTFDAAADGRL